MTARAIGVLGLVAIVLAGCSSHAGTDSSAPSVAGQIQRSVAVGDLVRDYQQARAAKQWDMALSYADQLQKLAPNSALASSVQATLADTSTHAEEAHDKDRLAQLWSYEVNATAGDDSDGALVTATIGSDDKSVASGDSVARLILRNHPKWGRSVGVLLSDGAFDCAIKCTVSVQFDDQPARPFAASTSGQAPRSLTIDDEQSIRESLDKVRVITISASIGGKVQPLSFSVGGFDRVALERKVQ